MRSGRHSNESEAPVEIAILGSEPSEELAGRRRSEITFGWFAMMLVLLYWRRHFPVWTTRFTLPLGAQGISKWPEASVGGLIAKTFAGSSWLQPQATGIFSRSGSGAAGSAT